ncbi:MAG: TRAP transporter substrate-binding protein [Bacillota bacterium]|nr:TRAP transporter substrate-binding protein [Bacillota bacterium]
MKKLLFVMMLVVAMVFCFAACAAEEPAAEDPVAEEPVAEGQQVTLRIGHVEAEDRSTHIALVNFKDRVEAESNGNITVEIYPNASIGDDAEMIAAVALGTLEMTLPATGNMSSYGLEWGVFDLPWLFTSPEAAFAACDNEIGDFLNGLLEGTGCISLGYTYNGMRCMSNNDRPIYGPEDCVGIDFRIMDSAVFRSMFELLGSNPTVIAFSEVYSSLQNGVVSGQENAPSLTYAMRFHEVQQYFSLTNHVHSFLPIVTNEAWYLALDETNRAIIDAAIADMIVEQRELELADYDKYVQMIADYGVEVNEVDAAGMEAFKEAVAPIYDEYLDTFGQEIYDLAAQYNEQYSN